MRLPPLQKLKHHTKFHYTVGGIVLQEHDSVFLLQGGCANRWNPHPISKYPNTTQPHPHASAENRETFMFTPGHAHQEPKDILRFVKLFLFKK